MFFSDQGCNYLVDHVCSGIHTTRCREDERRKWPVFYFSNYFVVCSSFLQFIPTIALREGAISHECYSPHWQAIKPVIDEQVFYDKFLCDKFYLPKARVYMQQILYDKFNSFHMTSFIYWCECVRKRCLSPPWQKNYKLITSNEKL